MKTLLTIDNLHVKTEEKEILKGVSLTVNQGEIHALMGPNGSGKSTLAQTIAGHPAFIITKGTIHFKGEDVTTLKPDERARQGMFLAFQYPVSVPGVTLLDLLRTAINVRRPEGKKIHLLKLPTVVTEKLELLGLNREFLDRPVNENLSGGEKKRAEILQLAVLQPELAILDETDSGLDIDALRIVAEGVKKAKTAEQGILLITHYQRMLNYITPDHVHVLVDGRIVESGGAELAKELETSGYDRFTKNPHTN